ncbi:MAG: hypothetical protein O2999_08635 [Nitrospirae bacterium]|nr:hypothetical protein [Nitrospirota bacterium]MDA1304350.1 hypothetical protein [Nitrospirota bacterium]
MPTLFNRNIPAEAHIKMGSMAKNLIQVFRLYLKQWLSDRHQKSTNFSEKYSRRMLSKAPRLFAGRTHHSLHCLSLSRRRWDIVTNRTYFARNIPDECFKKIGAFAKVIIMLNDGGLVGRTRFLQTTLVNTMLAGQHRGIRLLL